MKQYQTQYACCRRNRSPDKPNGKERLRRLNNIGAVPRSAQDYPRHAGRKSLPKLTGKCPDAIIAAFVMDGIMLPCNCIGQHCPRSCKGEANPNTRPHKQKRQTD